MTVTRAWLIDVWQTLLSVNFDDLLIELSDVAAVPVDCVRTTVPGYTEPVTIGELTVAEAFVRALEECGADPSRRRHRTISRATDDFLASRTTVFSDAVAFIKRKRQTGERVALVSNCGDDTRPLLEARGLLGLVDAAVLSCEVGIGKPDRGIFDHAVAALGVAPDVATLVDDQLSFCEGAVAAGLRAIHLDRAEAVQHPLRPDVPVVRSFNEIA